MLDQPEYPPEFFSPDPDKFITTFIGPTGTGLEMYVVAECPAEEEVKTGENLIGNAGQVFRKALVQIGVDINTITMWNVVPFRGYSRPQGQIKNRNPTITEAKFYSPYVKADIRKKRPKAILLFGAKAMAAFGIDIAVSTAKARTYSFEGIPVYVTFHPSHIARNKSERFSGYPSWINDLKRAFGIYIPPNVIPTKHDYTVIDVLDWDKVEAIFSEDEEVVLDYEASSLKVYHSDYFIGGLALKGLTTGIYVYVMLYNFWRTREEFEVSAELKARIGAWLLSKKLIVFNLQYECGASLGYFNVYIRNVLDVMMLNRTLALSGSLKEIAQSRLGVISWEVDVDLWKGFVETIAKSLMPTYRGKIRPEVIWIQENNCDSIDVLLEWFTTRKKSEMTGRASNCKIGFEEINKIAKDRFSENYNVFCKRFFALVIRMSNETEIVVRYTDIPVEIIAPYAINDVVYTHLIKDSLELEIKDIGDDEKVVRAAEIYNDIAKLGFEMESSGIAWDDELATQLDQKYIDRALSSLRSLLMIPQFQKILPSPNTDGKVVFNCPQDVLEIQTTTELNRLTEFFNPRSTHESTKKKFEQLIVTPRVKFLMLLAAVFKDYQNSEEACHKDYPVLCPLLEQITADSDPHERIKVIDELVKESQRVGDRIEKHPGNVYGSWKNSDGTRMSPPELRLYKEYAKWKLPGLKSEVIEDMYNAFSHIAGVNVDDESTWVEEFRYMFLFRMFKKVIKSYSTYIHGKTGRKNVALINKTDIHNIYAPRYPGWVEMPSRDQIWVKETLFGICTAVTKRCQSGDHTVPAKSELVDLRVSRFVDGVRLHWDLSQSEIRVLATMANDTNLLQKFAENADIHRFIASKIWSKPEADISDAERRYSKSAVFAVLYGDSPPSFAIKFLNGNVKLAKYIFTQLFSMFPNIEKFVQEQHRCAIANDEVYTHFGDPLKNVGVPVEVLTLSDSEKAELLKDVFSRKVRLAPFMERDKKIRNMLCKAFRNAQNYPIQSTSSTLAGYGIYNVSKFIRDEGLSARVDCFTHDSGDIDTQIADLPKLIKALPEHAINKVVEEFGIPIKADYEIGVSGNHMIGLSKLVVDGPVISSEFKSKRVALDALEQRLTQFGVKVEITVDKETENARSWSELFLARGAFNLALGQTEMLVTGKMRLDFSNVTRF